ncbi:glutathione S-transferase [Altererythrobacter xixiisoli]|uniref:Glutathione S-transferase n=1 Tax=Croceibacterium xixiisoli TaxID=1476466 RepID=A0A6I4TU19_9SPHN|nr:glutathione S-transferase family protein [Croceibacterium xixiisoli]MXO99332.1 glutathione S-transferase [Croceibacterium xixiisoli]
MARFTFYFNPMSRAQIARWALHEVDADYDPVFVGYEDKPADFLAANPMGKLPTIVHHHEGHDHVVSEAAAVCHYLALTHPKKGLLPGEHEAADYFRWLLFAAGPLEQAVTNRAFGWEPTEEQERTVGFGSYARTVDALDGWLQTHDFVCGSRFTMADVYVGSAVDWGLTFGTLVSRPSFTAYVERLRARGGYQAAKAIDMALIAEMQAQAPDGPGQ